MADELKVIPTPIQRNSLDVAMELTQLYYSAYGIKENIDEIQHDFLKFYAIADFADRNTYRQLVEFLPEEAKKLVK